MRVRSAAPLRRCFQVVAAVLIGSYAVALAGFQIAKGARLRQLERGSRVVTTPAGAVEFGIGGRGPAVVVLPGSFGGYDQAVAVGRQLLPDTFRVVAISRPGYLRTPIAVGRTPAEQADAVVPLLDSLGLTRVAVLGISGGGPAALELARRHPDRIWGMVLVASLSGPKVQPPARPLPPSVFDRILGAEFATWWQLVQLERSGLKALESPIFSPDTKVRLAADPARLAQYFELAWFRFPAALRDAGYRNDRDQFGRFNFDGFGAIVAPTLVVHGTLDRNAPIEHGDRSAASIAGAEYLRIEGADHFASIARAEEVRARIVAFLGRHAPPGS